MTTPLRALCLAALVLGGCARVHYAPAPAGDAGTPATPRCVQWWADPDYPEDARCVAWEGDDAGPQGCRLAPVYHIGDEVRCLSDSEGRDR